MLCDVFEATTTDFKVPSITQTFTSVLQFFFMSVSNSTVNCFSSFYDIQFRKKTPIITLIEVDSVVCRTVGQKHLTQIQTLLMLSQLNWLYPQQRYVLKSQWLVKYFWNNTKNPTSEFYVTNNCNI